MTQAVHYHKHVVPESSPNLCVTDTTVLNL